MSILADPDYFKTQNLHLQAKIKNMEAKIVKLRNAVDACLHRFEHQGRECKLCLGALTLAKEALLAARV